jgi:hypothetical protein
MFSHLVHRLGALLISIYIFCVVGLILTFILILQCIACYGVPVQATTDHDGARGDDGRKPLQAKHLGCVVSL